MVIDKVEVKPIPGFEEFYLASRDGRIWSIRRERWLNPTIVGDCNIGYLKVGLFKDGKLSNCRVHRLVALTWIPNPEELPQINHKDGNPSNNNVENLEWVSAAYNINYGDGNKRRSQTLSGKIPKTRIKCVETGQIWESIKACARETGIGYESLKRCVRGLKDDCHGLHFKEA